MKYRIKQKGIYFYPQYKFFLFWHNATFPRICTESYQVELVKYFPTSIALWIINYDLYVEKSLKNCEALLKRFIDSMEFKYKYKGHKIIKVYNNSSKILYIDVSVTTCSALNSKLYPIFSENLECVKESIDKYEQNKAISKIRNIFLVN